MEIKVKYQYTYFICPYTIEQNQYNQYINNLINDKRCKVKIFEKERDLDIYSYFQEGIREKIFPSFELTKKEKEIIEKKQIKEMQKIVQNQFCTILEYNLGKNAQGKLGEQNGIFFKIPKTEIICFRSGECFISIKTYLEESNNFQDVLNFNYKFRDINSEFTKLKEYQNIKIQTDIFNNMDELKEIIKDITGKRKIEDRFFTYTYTCIDSENWNQDINKIENEYLKYAYVLPSKETLNFNKETNLKTISQWQYIKIGATKQCSSLLASSIETSNYTKIPFDYENQYFYTLIINLYKKMYLENSVKRKSGMNIISSLNFCQAILTYDEIGEQFDKTWKEVFNIDKLYNKVEKQQNEINYKKNLEKNKITIRILITILIISIGINIINLLMLLFLMKT